MGEIFQLRSIQFPCDVEPDTGASRVPVREAELAPPSPPAPPPAPIPSMVDDRLYNDREYRKQRLLNAQKRAIEDLSNLQLKILRICPHSSDFEAIQDNIRAIAKALDPLLYEIGYQVCQHFPSEVDIRAFTDVLDNASEEMLMVCNDVVNYYKEQESYR